MHVHRLFAPSFGAHLADRLEERQRLECRPPCRRSRPGSVGAARALADALWISSVYVRDHLHGAAQVVARRSFSSHCGRSGRWDVAVAAGLAAQEALVMAEVQIGLGAVFGDEDSPCWNGTHGPRIDIDVGSSLIIVDGQPRDSRIAAEARRGDAFTQRRHHAAGNENKTGLRDVGIWFFMLQVSVFYGKYAQPRIRARQPSAAAGQAMPLRQGRRARRAGFADPQALVGETGLEFAGHGPRSVRRGITPQLDADQACSFTCACLHRAAYPRRAAAAHACRHPPPWDRTHIDPHSPEPPRAGSARQ